MAAHLHTGDCPATDGGSVDGASQRSAHDVQENLSLGILFENEIYIKQNEKSVRITGKLLQVLWLRNRLVNGKHLSLFVLRRLRVSASKPLRILMVMSGASLTGLRHLTCVMTCTV